jgi:arabinofuranan 3-O-arabinosyltransferase
VVSATVLAWAVAAAEWTWQCLRIDRLDMATAYDRANGVLGWDIVTLWRATHVFAAGGQPYSLTATGNRLFVYPPSALLLFRPVAALTQHDVGVVGLVGAAILTWATVMCSAAVLGRRWCGLTAALVLVALCWTVPMTSELNVENVTVLCAAALAVSYLLLLREHWVSAGAVIGVSLAVKPILLPVLLVFVLARKWRAVGVAVVIPAVLNVIAFVVVADPGEVWQKLPSILNRSGSGVTLNSAWVDVLRSFDVPDGVTILVRIVTVALTLLAAWWAWDRVGDAALRIVTTSSVLLIGTYLSGTLSENHYMLTLIPMAVTLVVPGSPMRRVAGGIGVLFIMGVATPPSVLGLDVDANQSAFRAFGMILILLTVISALARSTSRREPAGASVPVARDGAEPP